MNKKPECFETKHIYEWNAKDYQQAEVYYISLIEEAQEVLMSAIRQGKQNTIKKVEKIIQGLQNRLTEAMVCKVLIETDQPLPVPMPSLTECLASNFFACMDMKEIMQ